MLRYTPDRARPGLVALYDIWLGNGADQFLQPWSPHWDANRQEATRMTDANVLVHICCIAYDITLCHRVIPHACNVSIFQLLRHWFGNNTKQVSVQLIDQVSQ